MHTISGTRSADGLITRGVWFVWAALEVAAAFAVYAIMLILTWEQRVRERRALASLDDRLLRDIGISRADAEQEVRKPFWEV
jgi:uncharacterized protein YjiS (DUF1127 family)